MHMITVGTKNCNTMFTPSIISKMSLPKSPQNAETIASRILLSYSSAKKNDDVNAEM